MTRIAVMSFSALLSMASVSGSALASAHGLRTHALHQRGAGIGADVGFHTEVPRVDLFTRIHIEVSCLVVVFGGCGCCDQGGVAHKACLEQQAALAMNAVDNTKHLRVYVVILQSVAEPEDGEFIGQPGKFGQQRKLSVRGHIQEGFCHSRIRHAERELQKVSVQHSLHGKRRVGVLVLRVVKLNERYKLSPRLQPLQPFQELGIVDFPDVQAQW